MKHIKQLLEGIEKTPEEFLQYTDITNITRLAQAYKNFPIITKLFINISAVKYFEIKLTLPIELDKMNLHDRLIKDPTLQIDTVLSRKEPPSEEVLRHINSFSNPSPSILIRAINILHVAPATLGIAFIKSILYDNHLEKNNKLLQLLEDTLLSMLPNLNVKPNKYNLLFFFILRITHIADEAMETITIGSLRKAITILCQLSTDNEVNLAQQYLQNIPLNLTSETDGEQAYTQIQNLLQMRINHISMGFKSVAQEKEAPHYNC